MINNQDLSLSLYELETRLVTLETCLHRICDEMTSLLEEIQDLESMARQPDCYRKDDGSAITAVIRNLKLSYNILHQQAAEVGDQMKDLHSLYEIAKNRTEKRLHLASPAA